MQKKCFKHSEDYIASKKTATRATVSHFWMKKKGECVLLLQTEHISQRDRDGHGIGAGKDVGLVVGEDVGQSVVETAF